MAATSDGAGRIGCPAVEVTTAHTGGPLAVPGPVVGTTAWSGTAARVRVQRRGGSSGDPCSSPVRAVSASRRWSNAELERGAVATSDNLCVSDGRTAWGLLEPRRVPAGEGGSKQGRRMPHDRREVPWHGPSGRARPRNWFSFSNAAAAKTTTSAPCDPDEAAKSLVAGTYMAGELRRYWAFASTLALGTGVGDIHPEGRPRRSDADRRTPLSRSHAGRISRHAARQPRSLRTGGEERARDRRLRVAQIVTRFMAGAGGVALRGALALDSDRYEVVFVIGSGNRLIEEAETAVLRSYVQEHLAKRYLPHSRQEGPRPT